MTPPRQITFAPQNHILTNTAVWSPDGRWIVYDVRSDAEGSLFDGTRIERVNIETGEVQLLYETRNGACCGVATYDPTRNRVAFILGPEHPTSDWRYSAWHRQGVIVDGARPGVAENLDARDLAPPFTPGALRGGSHVHVFSPDGKLVSFTYEDHVLAVGAGEPNQRNVGVSVLERPVTVKREHPRNHDGAFSVLVTRTVARPRPGSDEISRAYEEAWIGRRRALAFIGDVCTAGGATIAEVFIVELPADLTRAGEGPLAGTAQTMPRPPAGVVQRRLTFTESHRYPGSCGPRHWVRASPDGTRIAFIKKDDAGIGQLWTLSPDGGAPAQLSRNERPIASAFTWSPDGRWIAHAMDGGVCRTDTRTGCTERLTDRAGAVPLPLACVFSPDGVRIAFLRRIGCWNQVFVQEITGAA